MNYGVILVSNDYISKTEELKSLALESTTIDEKVERDCFLVGKENSPEFHELIKIIAIKDVNGNQKVNLAEINSSAVIS